jgi:hypothetical protein
MLIEKARRLAHGYRNFAKHRLRMLLAASGTRTRRFKPGRRAHARARRAACLVLGRAGTVGAELRIYVS